jgi:hypothetical protein
VEHHFYESGDQCRNKDPNSTIMQYHLSTFMSYRSFWESNTSAFNHLEFFLLGRLSLIGRFYRAFELDLFEVPRASFTNERTTMTLLQAYAVLREIMTRTSTDVFPRSSIDSLVPFAIGATAHHR